MCWRVSIWAGQRKSLSSGAVPADFRALSGFCDNKAFRSPIGQRQQAASDVLLWRETRRLSRAEFYTRPSLGTLRLLVSSCIDERKKEFSAVRIVDSNLPPLGQDDPPRHIRFRTDFPQRVMLRAAGPWYVYFIYGKHIALTSPPS